MFYFKKSLFLRQPLYFKSNELISPLFAHVEINKLMEENMQIKNLYSVIIYLILILFITYIYLPGQNKQTDISLNSSSDVNESLIDINNITSWVSSSGYHDYKFHNNLWNGSFPKGFPAGVIFSEGILWGGMVNDRNPFPVRVNGGFYASGGSPIIHVFRVRPDYLTDNISKDVAAYFNEDVDSVNQNQIDSVRSLYQSDWDNWPSDMGAPYDDVNKDGKYDPNFDIPGVPGSAQTLFILYNDKYGLFASPLIGLKVSETYWAYNSSNHLNNVIFKKVSLIYEGTSTSNSNSNIDSMYIVQFADPDLGDGADDFVGCDPELNLGYVYNSSNDDNVFKSLGLNPPAVGYIMLSGVSQNSGNPNDKATINLKLRKGYKYVNQKHLSSFIYSSIPGSWITPDPYSDTRWNYYNIMREKLPSPPYPLNKSYPSSVTSKINNRIYLLDGDPVTGTGKLDGVFDKPGDRRMFLINGPFKLQIGDTAEVVVALAAAMGNDNLESISLLKKVALSADSSYKALVNNLSENTTSLSNYNNKQILKFSLEQNYPNPFNPTTKISYHIPKNEYVSLKVYDILGKEVAILVNKNQNSGNYNVNFDASSLPSGIYFYKLQAGNYIDTKKMLLMK